ncbi:VanZ family protein [Scytonema millei]|uniref:VanZ family protein n=1 Tax=Scytonema millei VB511283 TaxID=1245923 RepID=A0A9X5E7J7_9CYAN|nr:VanZ family protein [Scytonema millei]NHC36228.1 VanZ family protein [Scytonema millei VB511283]
MHVHPSASNSTIRSLRQFLVKSAPYIVIASILLVVVATLFPFNFSRDEGGSLRYFLSNFKHSSHLGDKIKNIFLFIPFGFGITCFLQAKKLNLLFKLILVVVLSFSLSFAVETLQIFLPSRETSPADLLTNSLGGFIGFLCFYIWKFKIVNYILNLVENNKNQFSLPIVVVAFLGYLATSILFTVPLQSANNLSTWDLNYPLILGNERTGERPWEGFISEVAFADKAFSSAEIERVFASQNWWNNVDTPLLGHYQLDRQNYSDRTGTLPDLSWRGQLPEITDDRGVFLSDRHWLQSNSPVNLLNQRLQASSKFTIITTIATNNFQQKGPARIVSISESHGRRNFTLGQQGNHLNLRLRTPINGVNAQYLDTNVYNVFTDNRLHKLVITYANSGLHVYVDKLQNRHDINLLEILPKEDRILYYGLTFIPLGALLAVVITLAKKQFIRYILFYAGVLLPTLIVEIILATSSGRSFEIANILLGLLMTASTTLILKLQIPFWLRNKVLNYANHKNF